MFNSKHYVPILKWKRAEQGALKSLAKDDKKFITPLIQFVMPKQAPHEQLESIVARFDEQSEQIPEKIIDVWGFTPVFVDVSLLFTIPLKARSLSAVLEAGHKLGGTFIPIVHLKDDQQIKDVAFSSAKETKSGLCLRLICSDFTETVGINQDIAKFLEQSELSEKDIDLLVDIKETEKNGDKCAKYLTLSQNIPDLLRWRTFIFASGSFPKDLSEYKLDEENLIPRVDWKSWVNHSNGTELKRKPAFADYTIQYPIYRDMSQFFHPTTSIKYTLENEWFVMKGERQKFDKYLANAALLVKDSRFYGEDFSDGDKYIAEKAKHFEAYAKNPAIKGTGSTETWLRAGINHHLGLVVHQLANLP